MSKDHSNSIVICQSTKAIHTYTENKKQVFLKIVTGNTISVS